MTKNIEFNIAHINNKIVQMKLNDRTQQPQPNAPMKQAGSKTRLKKKNSVTRVKDFKPAQINTNQG